MTLAELLEAATPPEHGEDTWEMKQAWDRFNEAVSELESRAREIAQLCLDMGDAMRRMRHDYLPNMPTCDCPHCRRIRPLLARLNELGESGA